MDEHQRMILRRTGDEAASTAEASGRVREAEDVILLQEASPSMLLVEGDRTRVEEIASELSGWSVFPLQSYKVPDTRPKPVKAVSR